MKSKIPEIIKIYLKTIQIYIINLNIHKNLIQSFILYRFCYFYLVLYYFIHLFRKSLKNQRFFKQF